MITGGARSGKSSFAENLAKNSKKPVAYLATAIPLDDGMEDRIQKHRASRPREWITYEGYRDLHKVVETMAGQHEIVLLDCMTIMITNLLFEDPQINWDTIAHERIDGTEEWIRGQVVEFLASLRSHGLWGIIVTNEVGMGIVPESRLSRIFRDIAGRINQMIACEADEVYFTVSGIPMKLK